MNNTIVDKKGNRLMETAKKKLDVPVPVELDADVVSMLNQCMAEVFKEYLPNIADSYSVLDYPDPTNSSESVAYFDITKLLLEKGDKVIDKLKNVYDLIAMSNNTIALIINRKHDKCRLSLAVGIKANNSEYVKNLANSLRDAIVGNFPGTECSEVFHYSENGDAAFAPLNPNINFTDLNFSSVGIVSNIASDYSEDFLTQGIEKLIDGICPNGDSEYTMVIMGESLPATKLEEKKDKLYQMYTALSPFSKLVRNWGTNEGKNWSNTFSQSIFASQSISAEAGVVFAKASTSTTVGTSSTLGHTWGGSTGVSEGSSIEITRYGVKHTLDVIEGNMKRIEQCEALGLWNFAAYVFSSDYNLVNEVTHMYRSLTQGKESFYERPSINIWNAQSQGGVKRPEIEKIRNYVSHLRHPVFEKQNKAYELFNGGNWPVEVTCTSEISGSELVRALNLPRKSVPGVAVIESAPFGREIVTYSNFVDGDISMGVIHHMHHDEEMEVELDSNSLTSHVFVTGSTGSGKSNTVYRLLDQTKQNFLVIEPAKGEYKNVFGSDVYKFTTNPSLGQLLQVNPFAFPLGIHVYEHIDRLLEVFNVCWPMYAAMPAVLKDAIIRAYESVGWDMKTSVNRNGELYPTFENVCEEIDEVIKASDYSDENKGNYRGALKTRLQSLTNGLNGLIFCQGNIPDDILFDNKTIIDLSRMGSAENKSLTMGILVIKLEEHRITSATGMDEGLKHITVLEEAHHLLRGNSGSSSPEMGGGMAAKSVEMLANAIAEMRTYGEGFVIVDQSPGLMDMSVIRNTNTKIIMRLPDQGDRELVGRAANLNDNQIQELAKLQRGVAAVYQNEWIEPVLCHVARHEISSDKGEKIWWQSEKTKVSEEELRYINSCLYDPNYLKKKVEYSFIDCVDKLDVSSNLKSLMKDYARMPLGEAMNMFEKVAYRYFSIDRYVSSINSQIDKKTWKKGLLDYLRDNNIFMDDTDFSMFNNASQLFSSLMLDVSINNQLIEKNYETIELLGVLV